MSAFGEGLTRKGEPGVLNVGVSVPLLHEAEIGADVEEMRGDGEGELSELERNWLLLGPGAKEFAVALDERVALLNCERRSPASFVWLFQMRATASASCLERSTSFVCCRK
jgi:hypothetical protein